MGAFFNANEVCQFAIRIEENGERFYRKYAGKFDNAKVIELFTTLADQEVKHKEYFESLVSQLQDYEPPESFPGEYFEYLRAYVDKMIFDPEELQKHLSRIKEPADAVGFAIERELDSILYYQEIKNVVPVAQHDMIDKIIQEERRHFLLLTGLGKVL